MLLSVTLAALLAQVKAAAPPESLIRFENHAVTAGIAFVLNNGAIPDKPILDSVLGGAAVLDFDRDGFPDLYFTNGAALPALVKSLPAFSNRLYRNNGDGTFLDVTSLSGTAGEGYSMGAAAADFDNDGYPDLYVTGYDRNILFRNNRNGTFTDVTVKAGVTGELGGRKQWSVSAAWFDYDNDGYLDLLVANYLDWTFANNQLCGPIEKRLTCPPARYSGTRNALYHNNHDGTFTDVSAKTGIGAPTGKGMGIAIADYDNDGWMDVFIGNDNERNFLLHNEKGTFREVGVESATAYNDDGIPVSSMGVDFRDLNNDGLPDIVVTALGGESFPLYLNEGNGFFSASHYQLGIGFGSRRLSGWGAGLYDFDNDGHKDLFTANSHVSENAGLLDPLNLFRQPNVIFRNDGSGHFQELSEHPGTVVAHRGAVFADFNNDGKIDAALSAIASPAELLINRSPGAVNWILIDTEGTKSNRDGIGTRIKLTSASGKVQYNHVTTSVGYASSSDKRVHFGLGADTGIREIELRWPSGAVQVLRDVKGGQILKVVETSTLPPPGASGTPLAPRRKSSSRRPVP